MKDPRPLVQHIYEMEVEVYLNEMRTGHCLLSPSIDAELFRSLHTESTVQLPHALHNNYINYNNHKYGGDHTDTTPVYWSSIIYHFMAMRRC